MESKSSCQGTLIIGCSVLVTVDVFRRETQQSKQNKAFLVWVTRTSNRPKGLSWLWPYGSWIYNYLCNQCQSLLTLWVRIPLRRDVLDTALCDKVCQWLATGRWFSTGTPVSSTNKTDHHEITEISLKVALKHQKSINQLNRRMALSSHHERMVNSRKACRSKKKINNLDSWSYGHDERSSKQV